MLFLELYSKAGNGDWRKSTRFDRRANAFSSHLNAYKGHDQGEVVSHFVVMLTSEESLCDSESRFVALFVPPSVNRGWMASSLVFLKKSKATSPLRCSENDSLLVKNEQKRRTENYCSYPSLETQNFGRYFIVFKMLLSISKN